MAIMRRFYNNRSRDNLGRKIYSEDELLLKKYLIWTATHLLEYALVMVIIGTLIVLAFSSYLDYLQDKIATHTYEVPISNVFQSPVDDVPIESIEGSAEQEERQSFPYVGIWENIFPIEIEGPKESKNLTKDTATSERVSEETNSSIILSNRILSDAEYMNIYYSTSTLASGEKYNLEELKILSATIYSEASASTDLRGALSVGWVVRNRLENWGYETYTDVIIETEPCTQFAVTLLDDWEERVNEILYMDTERARIAVTAAKMVMNAENPYELPSKVVYFYGDQDIKQWGTKSYYGTYGGNSFFY